MAMCIPPLKGWSSKHLVVAAMIGTLVVVAIAAVIIVDLTPPQVFFSIEDASLQFYNFTLSANNTSRRMEVHYTTLNTEIWITPSDWYSAELSMSGFTQQPPDNVTKFAGWAESYQLDSMMASAQGSGAGNWPNCTVVVIAKVLFKVGLARTRPYHIRVSCFPVNFRDKTRYANCTY
ncbi:hypothetical protein SEVIR_8G245200v4 [Setaria viridis]|uniref:Late embryogenesis abundant protein LEA-2 subgroup domain-containing protein n=1 Tax=Setaria viridis TaxID=4556 RepID=A0A4U6TJ81_SETVI|nr:hypothetical protein SEVIR_8G245200v2 [Setaria viridis]